LSVRTPSKFQQWGILIGAVTSALVIGFTMLMLNKAGTHYTTKNLPSQKLVVPPDAPTQRPGKPYTDDATEYHVVHVRRGDYPADPTRGLTEVRPGRYLVDADGTVRYKTDTPIAQESRVMDDNNPAPARFTAPQPHLFSNIIQGILGGTLEWGLVVIGALIAIVVELVGVTALPFAVGMYIPLASTVPIFIGGLLRLVADRLRGKPSSEAESETSPGVLLASGYIAGGTLCGLIVAFFAFSDDLVRIVNLGLHLFGEVNPQTGNLEWDPDESRWAKVMALAMFGALAGFLLYIGSRKQQEVTPTT
jgi:hypothetical protein